VRKPSVGEATSLFTYSGPSFAITAITPTTGRPGRNGDPGDRSRFQTGLSSSEREATSVTLEGEPAAVAVAPAVRCGSVEAERPDGLRVTGPSSSTYVEGAATITDFRPLRGPAAGGFTLFIRGSNFIPETIVTVGGASVPSADVVFTSTTGLDVRMPPGLGAVPSVFRIRHERGGCATLFTYISQSAAITSFSPDRGSRFGDTLVRVEGSGFSATTDVFFGDRIVSRERIAVLSETILEVMSPAHDPGAVRISVQNPGTSPVASTTDYRYEPLAVSGCRRPRPRCAAAHGHLCRHRFSFGN